MLKRNIVHRNDGQTKCQNYSCCRVSETEEEAILVCVIRSPKKDWKIKWNKFQSILSDAISESLLSCLETQRGAPVQHPRLVKKGQLPSRQIHYLNLLIQLPQDRWRPRAHHNPRPHLLHFSQSSSFRRRPSKLSRCGQSSGSFQSFNSSQSGPDQNQIPLRRPTPE